MTDRFTFFFHNPNHAAALACALLPLCLGWRRAAWVGRTLAVALFAAMLLTQSRTGLLVAALELAAWWALRRGERGRRPLAWLVRLAVAALAVGLSFWWLGPRLALDGSVLNRPKIWLAGLRLFSANPSGVGLGNSGALASAFHVPDGVPEVRTLVSSHLTLLAECGWLVGWTYLALLALALCGVRRSPRAGLAFAGLVLSACASSVFDWPVLLDFAAQGGLGWANWTLSWLSLALFVAFGVRLLMSATLTGRREKATTDSHGLARMEGRKPAALNAEGVEERRRREGGKIPRLPFSVISALSAVVLLAGALVLAARCVPPGGAPRVRGGYAASGVAPRTLALYDGSWSLRDVRACAGRDALVPVRPVSRFPCDVDFSSVGRVLLFGDCREWAYLVKGVPVECASD